MNFTKDKNSTAALVLIAAGVLALLGTLGVFRLVGDVLGTLLFGGLAYLAYTEGKRRGDSTWRLAAFPLAGLAIATIAPARLGGGAFLASLGLAFAVYWQEDKSRWWALIPAGTLASLAMVTFFESSVGASVGWLFLLGMALTFFALTRLEVDPQPWATWPAAALGVAAFLAMTRGGSWLLPVLLIGAGAFLLLRREGLFGISVKVERRDAPAAAAPPAEPVAPPSATLVDQHDHDEERPEDGGASAGPGQA